MKIAILGATGQVGSHLVAEALGRGHLVTGIARYPDALHSRPGLTLVKADVTAPTNVSQLLRNHDAVLSAVPFLVMDAATLLEVLKGSNLRRLLVVGGAGSLEIAPGNRLVDTNEFPLEYKAEALAGCRFLETLRNEEILDWTFLSPSAFLYPGPRTGIFRLGGDALLVDGLGKSHISLSDFAVALIDELEHPKHTRLRFTAGY